LVESTQKLNFPDSVSSSGNRVDSPTTTSSNSVASNNIGPQLQGIVGQLANDIDSTKNSLDTLSKTNTNTQKTIQDLKGSNDRMYMIGTGAIGVGVAGIVIAAVALSRREVIKLS
jgi:hypothetical protein